MIYEWIKGLKFPLNPTGISFIKYYTFYGEKCKEKSFKKPPFFRIKNSPFLLLRQRRLKLDFWTFLNFQKSSSGCRILLKVTDSRIGKELQIDYNGEKEV